MKVGIIIISILVCVLFIGCYGQPTIPTGYSNVPPVTNTITITKTLVENVSTQVVTTTKIVDMNNNTFMLPTGINLPKYKAGDTRNFKIQIHNGEDEDKEFGLWIEIPEKISIQPSTDTFDKYLGIKGVYVPASIDVVKWVNINNPIKVQSKWTENCDIRFAVPNNVVLPDRWYYFIRLKDLSQGMVGTATDCVIFVTAD